MPEKPTIPEKPSRNSTAGRAAGKNRPRRWTSLPASERVAERRKLLVRAGFEILGSDGWGALTVRSLIERADLNVRYFYESFNDLDGVAVAVYDQVVERMAALIITALEASPADPAAQVGAVVRAVVDFVDEDRRRGRILYAEGLGSEALNRRRLDAGEALVSFVEHYAAENVGQPAPGEVVGRVGASILVGGFSQLLLDWLSDRLPVTKDRFVSDATEIFLAIGDTASAIAARRIRARRDGT